MLIIVYMLNGCPLYKRLYVVLILFQSYVWSKTFLIRRTLIETIIPSIQHSFIDWFSFLLLATIKIWEQQALNTIIHSHLFFQTLLCILTITSSRYLLPASCTSFQAKWRIQVFRLKFVQKMDLGLEFQKTNLRIRISILKI